MAKKEIKELATISPKNISKLPFGKDLADYRNNLKLKSSLAAELEVSEITLRAFIAKCFGSDRFVNLEGVAHADLSKHLVIYKKHKKTAKQENVEFMSRAEGSSFYEISKNKKVMELISNVAGIKATALIEEVARFHAEQHFRDPEVDEDATKEAKKELNSLIDVMVSKRSKLNEVKSYLENMKEYIEVCKDVASIADFAKRNEEDE